MAIELKSLNPLPAHRTTDFSVATVTVTRFGTISLRGVLYTVPSRLIGSRLKGHLFDDRLVCHLGATSVLSLERKYRRAGDKAVRQVDYRHPIASLVRKPQAFRQSVFREHLFPRQVCRRAWDALDARLVNRVLGVMRRGRPYVLRDLDGRELSVAEAKALVLQRFTVPDHVRASCRANRRSIAA